MLKVDPRGFVIFGAVLAACSTAVAPIGSPSPTEIVRPNPTLSASPTPTPPPAPEPTSDLLCADKLPLEGLYRPERVAVIERCRTVTGTVASVRAATFGEIEIALTVDLEFEATLLNLRNMTDRAGNLVLNLICVGPLDPSVAAACGVYRNDLRIPRTGDRVSVTGPLVLEKAEGWNAIHPLRLVNPILTPPSDVPPAVRAAKAQWSQIGAAWPMLPPMVFAGTSTSGPAAALYPDGLAHLILSTDSPAPEPHTVWHEAGHILHAAALKSRGQLDNLFKPTDTVGVDYWKARGYPGAWSDHLLGEWRVLGYEALAESFAAVNLGDTERTETYGVPLDRAAMRVFFQGLFAQR